MDINIYEKYKVTITSRGATKTYEGFEDYKYTGTQEVEGGQLLEWIAKELLDENLQSIKVRHDGIQIETFNPWTGEGGEVIYEIEVINNANNNSR